MQFCVVVHKAPYLVQAPVSALRFCQAVLKSEHHLRQVFFQQSGVLVGNRWAQADGGSESLFTAWQELGMVYGIPLILCSASVKHFGVISESNSIDGSIPGFIVAGLGQLVEAMAQADRVVNFG